MINGLLRTHTQDSVYVSSHNQFRQLEGLTERQVMAYVTRDALVPQAYETMHVLKKGDLSLNMQVFTELIQTVILPRKGHVDSVNFLDIWVMGALGLGFPIDIGNLITRYMHTARLHPQQSLPYSGLITLILYKVQADIDPDEPVYKIPHRQHLSIATFRARHWEKIGGVWQIKPKAVSGEASSSKRSRVEHSADEAAETAPAAPAATSSSRTDEKLDLILARMDSFAETVHGLTTSIQTLQTHMDSSFEEQRRNFARQQEQLDDLQRSLGAYMGD